MSKKFVVVVAAILALASLPGACKKKGEEQPAPAPAAQAPAAAQPAAQPTPPAKAPEPAVPEKTAEPATPPPAAPAEVKTDVKGNVKGADIALGFAYARIEEGNQKLVISFRDKELLSHDCNDIDSSSPDSRVLYVMLATGPKGDLSQGKAVPVDPMEYLNNEGDWSVDDGDAAITITKLDLPNKTIEGSILIDRKAGDEKGKLEGTFKATICTNEGVPMELKPSVPELPTTAAAWKMGTKDFTIKSAAAKLVKNEDNGQAYWDIFLSSGDVSCDSLSIGDTDTGFDLMVYQGPSGQFPIGYPVPLDDWGYYPVSADVGSAPDSRFCDINEDDSAVQLTEIGTGDNAKLKGVFSIDQECSLTNATADADYIHFQTTGGGTFEAVICPAD